MRGRDEPKLHNRLARSTIVYVTHDQVEAMTMADRVAVMRDGVLQQCASPRELFTNPRNIFVAGFIGSPAMNLMPATMTGDAARVGSLTLPITPGQRSALSSGRIVVGVRPESFDVAARGGLDAHVDLVEELGSESFLYCSAPGVADKQVVVRSEGWAPRGVAIR